MALSGSSQGEVEVGIFAPVEGTFSYQWRFDYEPATAFGCRVLVPFGPRQVVGVLLGPAGKLPDRPRLRPISEVLDQTPLFSPQMLELLRWVARYYYAPLGEVLRAALPAVLAKGARRSWRITTRGREALEAQGEALVARDLCLSTEEAAALRRLTSAKKGHGFGRKEGTLARAALRLAERGFVEGQLDLPIARPRLELQVEVLEHSADARCALARRAPRQAEVLAYLAACEQPVRLSEWADRPADTAALARKLEEKGLVRCSRSPVQPDPFAESELPEDVSHRLTDEQSSAVEVLAEATRGSVPREGQHAFLLRGVTGSGKTEIYLQLIAALASKGQGAIVMVPEIALTPQLAGRFRARFGERVAVLHSGLSDAARYDQWQRIRSGQLPIVVGARSAVFAPTPRLGAIIIDEEHDSSFKQEEGVRYNARDLALVRGSREGALVVLGSATPSLESLQLVRSGRLGLLMLSKRPTARPLPRVEVVDLRVTPAGKEGALSGPMLRALDETLGRGEQSIIFLNRRGFSPFVQCRGCGQVFSCVACSVSLTHHSRGQRLVCHYCGHSAAFPERCPQCSGTEIAMRGVGTERVEALLAERFPAARIARMDRDTTTGTALQRLITRIHQREVDIIVGTQMVSKGHDFPGVTLVGVLSADQGLHFPDFRAGERTFQLLTQVAGRAGRGERPGRVLIQSYDPEHPVIIAARSHDYDAFSRYELGTREELVYPPFAHLAVVHISGEAPEEVLVVVQQLATTTRKLAAAGSGEVLVLGPAEAPIQRIKGRVRWMLMLKSKRRTPLRRVVDGLRSLAASPRVRVVFDIDPVNML